MAERIPDSVFDAKPEQITPLKSVLTVIVAVSTVIGLLPYVFYIKRYPLVILTIGLIAGAVGSWWRLRNFESLSTEKPRLGEFLLGGLSTLFPTTMTSIGGLIIFWLTKAVLWLVQVVVRWFNEGTALPLDGIADWVSLIFLAIFGVIYIIYAVDRLSAKLYPKTAGIRTPFYSLLLERRRLILMVLIAVCVLAAIFLFFRPGGNSFAIAIMFYLVYTGAILDNFGKSASTTPDKRRALKALTKLLKATGYETTPSPRTGNSEVDPLIVTVDILAQSPDRAKVIEVKTTTRKNDPIEWHEASRLRNAAWALEDEFKQQDGYGSVAPVMVLIGRKKADSLTRFLEEEPMQVIEVEDVELISQILAEEDEERLRQLAADHFGIEVVDPIHEKSLIPAKEKM